MDPFTALTLALTAGDWIIGAIQRGQAGDPPPEQQKADVGDTSALDAADARWHGTAAVPPDVALVRANLAAQPDVARHHLESLAAIARGEVVPPPADAERVAELTAENARVVAALEAANARILALQSGAPDGGLGEQAPPPE